MRAFSTLLIKSLGPLLGFALLTWMLASKADAQQARQLNVDPIDISKIQPLSPDQVADRVRELSETARSYQTACERFDREFDGSPEAASKVALLKLQMLSSASLAITVSSGAIENFRCTALLQRSRNAADQAAIDSEIKKAATEVNHLAGEFKVSGDQLEGNPAEMLLMVKKLERLEELREDAVSILRSQQAIDQTLDNLRSLNDSIRTFSVLMQEEVKRQSNAINSNRIAKQSTVISNQAERLYASVRSLSPVVNSINTRVTRSLNPSIIPPKLPEDIQPKLTPEMQHKLREYIKTLSAIAPAPPLSVRPTGLQARR